MDVVDDYLLARTDNASTRYVLPGAQPLDSRIRIGFYVLNAVLLSVYWYYKVVTFDHRPLFRNPRLDGIFFGNDRIRAATVDIENMALFVGHLLLLIYYISCQTLRSFSNLNDGLDANLLSSINILFWQLTSRVEFWIMTAATIHYFGEFWYYYSADDPGLLEESIHRMLDLVLGTLEFFIIAIDDLMEATAEVAIRYFDEQETMEEAEIEALDAIR